MAKDKKKKQQSGEQRQVDCELRWKLYFNKDTKQVIAGLQGNVILCDPDKQLPPMTNQPPYVEERFAVLQILKK